jgi:hypothetical protein
MYKAANPQHEPPINSYTVLIAKCTEIKTIKGLWIITGFSKNETLPYQSIITTTSSCASTTIEAHLRCEKNRSVKTINSKNSDANNSTRIEDANNSFYFDAPEVEIETVSTVPANRNRNCI